MVGRLNVNVGPELHRELKILAANKDTSVNALVEQAVKDLIEKEKQPPK